MAGRVKRRDIKPTGIQGRHSKIINFSETVEDSATLAYQASKTFEITTASDIGLPLLVQEDIALFEGSVSQANYIPTGANVTPGNYQVIGPWREQDDGDGKNIVSKVFVRNNTSSVTEEHVVIDTGDDYKVAENLNQRVVAQSSNGEIITVYLADNSANNSYDITDVDLKFEVSSDNGDTWGSETDIVSSVDMSFSNSSGDYEIWIDGSNHVHVAWFEGATSSTTVIKYCKLTYSSGTWSAGTVRTVRTGDASNFVSRITLTVQASGRIFVVYQHENGFLGGTQELRYRYSDDDGATWSTEANVYATDTNGALPRLTLRNNSPFLVFAEGSGFVTKWSVWSGSSWSTPATITGSAFYGNLSIVEDDSNNVHLVGLARNASPTPDDVHYFNYNGTSWSTKETLSATNESVEALSLTVDDDGQSLHLFYANPTSGVVGDISTRTRTAGTWSSQSTLGTEDAKENAVKSPHTFSTNGNIFVVYRPGTADNSPVKVYREEITGTTKTVLFRGRTRYITERRDVTIT